MKLRMRGLIKMGKVLANQLRSLDLSSRNGYTVRTKIIRNDRGFVIGLVSSDKKRMKKYKELKRKDRSRSGTE